MKQQTERLEIYGTARKNIYEKELVRLKNSGITPHNKELITAWHNHKFATGSNSLTVAKRSSQMREITQHLAKELDSVVKTDVEALVARINRTSTWREPTKADYRRTLKEFYKWLENEDTRLQSEEKTRIEAQKLYKYLRNDVKISYKFAAIDYSEIISEEDLESVLQKGTMSLKEKAFLAVLHESGLRAGEMLNIRIKDIEIKDTHALLRVDGKTGQRRVTVVQCMPYLTNWLSLHPFRDNPQSFIWTGESSNHMHQPLHHRGAQKLVDRCFKRAGVKKKKNLHWFRHSRATIYGSRMPEAVLCSYFGWTLGSKQVRTYVHMSGEQVENTILSVNGVERNNHKNALRNCSCGTPNKAGSKYCYRCGKPMDATVLHQQQQAEELAYEELRKILADPELRRRFDEILVQEREKESRKFTVK